MNKRTDFTTHMNLNKNQFSYLEKGLTAIREKRYFDTHEEWEFAWRELQGDQKLFWQAMIQLSVGAYHYTNNNLTGCRNLWNKAANKCSRILDKGEVNDLLIVRQLKDILEECLKAVSQNTPPLPIVENAAQNIISEKWLELE
jgi:predicted metal-dependent hydrolase